MLGRALRRDLQERLDSLREADEYLYRFSALRKEPKDFSYQELRREVERRQLLQPLHDLPGGHLHGQPEIVCLAAQVLHGLQTEAQGRGARADIPVGFRL